MMRLLILALVSSALVAGNGMAQTPVAHAAAQTGSLAENQLQLVGGCSGGCGSVPSATVVAAPLAGASCGCNTNSASAGLFHRLINPFTIGEGCRSTPYCSNLAQERTFMFGSCNQFFNAGNKCNLGNFGLPRPHTVFGPGGLGNNNNCVYGTFIGR